ncbi:MAG: acyl-homoserine-lactone synthase, partial [Methyloceanibacter sp.]
YMLRDVFPELLEGRPAPAHPRIWECSRFAVDKGPLNWIDGRLVREMTFRLMEALAEFCLARDIGSMVTVYDRRVGRLLEFMNCKPQWTSRALSINGVSTQAGLFSISTMHLSTVRSAIGLAPAILPPQPAIAARNWAQREPLPVGKPAMGMRLDA